MANDDHRDDPIPEPDAPPSDLELERAASFGDLIDGLLDGAPSPPAMRADERTLIEVASVVHAVAGDPARTELDATRTSDLIEAALRKAVAAPNPPISVPGTDTPRDAEPDNVTSLASRRLKRTAPWLLTVVAAAAAAFFALRPPQQSAPTARTDTAPATRLTTDELVGRIHQRDAGKASSRIDIIYTDRLALYRNGKLGGLR